MLTLIVAVVMMFGVFGTTVFAADGYHWRFVKQTDPSVLELRCKDILSPYFSLTRTVKFTLSADDMEYDGMVYDLDEYLHLDVTFGGVPIKMPAGLEMGPITVYDEDGDEVDEIPDASGAYSLAMELYVNGEASGYWVSTSFGIIPQTLFVYADDNGKVYGEEDPELTYSIEGYDDPDTWPEMTGELEREPGEDVGEYVIDQGTLSPVDENFDMAFIPGTFSIVKADAEFTQKPLPGLHVYRKGVKHKLLARGGKTDDGVVMYALKTSLLDPVRDKDYSVKIPTAEKAGLYYVRVKIEGDSNHNDTDMGCIPVIIAREAVGGFSIVPFSVDPQIIKEMDIDRLGLGEIIKETGEMYLKGGIRFINMEEGKPILVFVRVGKSAYNPLTDGKLEITYSGRDENGKKQSGRFIPGITRLEAGTYTLTAKLGATKNHKTLTDKYTIKVHPAKDSGKDDKGSSIAKITPAKVIIGKIIIDKVKDKAEEKAKDKARDKLRDTVKAVVRFNRLLKNVKKYQVCLTDKKTGKSRIIDVLQPDTRTISVTLDGLDRNTTYKVKVRAVNVKAGLTLKGGWSKTMIFKTK